MAADQATNFEQYRRVPQARRVPSAWTSCRGMRRIRSDRFRTTPSQTAGARPIPTCVCMLRCTSIHAGSTWPTGWMKSRCWTTHRGAACREASTGCSHAEYRRIQCVLIRATLAVQATQIAQLLPVHGHGACPAIRAGPGRRCDDPRPRSSSPAPERGAGASADWRRSSGEHKPEDARQRDPAGYEEQTGVRARPRRFTGCWTGMVGWVVPRPRHPGRRRGAGRV